MAEVHASAAVWHIRADGIELSPNEIELSPNEKAPRLLRLYLCGGVRIVLDREAPDTAEQAKAMRRLAQVAAEAAEDLERHASGGQP